MSLLESLRPKRGSTHKKHRVGRGDASGWGGTAGRGHKGQKSRSGAPIPRGFEGGQTPLARRLPKFGFTNAKFKTQYELVSLEQLNQLSGEVTPESLWKSGVISKKGNVKVLAKGELKQSLVVVAHKFSKSAKEAIEKAGGEVKEIPQKPKWKRSRPVKKA